MDARRILLLIAAAAAVQSQARDIRWIGATSGEWTEASNWDPAVIPNSEDDCAVFDGQGPTSVTVASERRVGGIRFSGADYAVTGAFQLKEGSGGMPFIFVEEGRAATINANEPHVADNAYDLSKTGGGTLVHAGGLFGRTYRRYRSIDVREGVLKFAVAGDLVNASRVIVRDGARCWAAAANVFPSSVEVQVEKGGVFDSAGNRDTLGGFSGAGVVNLGETASSATVVAGGPFLFSGRIHGRIELDPQTGFATGEGGMTLGSPDSLEEADVVIRGGTGFDNVLRLDDGVAAFCARSLIFAKTNALTSLGAAFKFRGASSLLLANGAAVTVGAGGAAAGSSLVRDGHGVLSVSSLSDDARLGTAATLSVAGGVSIDAVTGVPSEPIFEACPVSAYGIRAWRINRLLATDGADGLVPATPTAFDPSSSTASTVAEIRTTAVNLMSDASVGTLCMEYVRGTSGEGGLSIADGVTLSIGSGTPGAIAPLLLNNTFVSATGSATVEGGSIDFGAAEGLILVNYCTGVMPPTRISSSIRGTGGLTLAAFAPPSADASPGRISLTAANEHSGGTWIVGATVLAGKAGCLSSGTVSVDGGALVVEASYDSDSLDNPLVLSGDGESASVSGACCGALVARRSMRMAGGVTMAADATVRLDGGGEIVFDSPVTGAGRLTLSGGGSFVFASPNTNSGGIVVAGGVADIAEAAALGTGPVEVCSGATLRFMNQADITVTNRITGTGTVHCKAANVTFSDISGFRGTLIRPREGFTLIFR